MLFNMDGFEDGHHQVKSPPSHDLAWMMLCDYGIETLVLQCSAEAKLKNRQEEVAADAGKSIRAGHGAQSDAVMGLMCVKISTADLHHVLAPLRQPASRSRVSVFLES